MWRQLRDDFECTPVVDIPTTDGVIPTLDGTSSMAANDYEANKDAEYEDGYGNPAEGQGSMQNSPGVTNPHWAFEAIRYCTRPTTGPPSAPTPTIRTNAPV